MSGGDRLLGIPLEAAPAWASLVLALDRLADRGRHPICETRPDDWASDAPARARRDAVEACGHCPVRSLCDDYATAADERCHVWGGTDRTPQPSKRREKTASATPTASAGVQHDHETRSPRH
jgi:hypothetical protein